MGSVLYSMPRTLLFLSVVLVLVVLVHAKPSATCWQQPGTYKGKDGMMRAGSPATRKYLDNKFPSQKQKFKRQCRKWGRFYDKINCQRLDCEAVGKRYFIKGGCIEAKPQCYLEFIAK